MRFFRLINNTNWRISAKIINKPKQFNTIHRRYQEWINNSLICSAYDDILNEYKLNTIAEEIYY